MNCSRCHADTPILVNKSVCWACAFPRSFDLAAQQHALADDEREAFATKAALLSAWDH
jgi:predicted amidophosphoribosyltransferase